MTHKLPPKTLQTLRNLISGNPNFWIRDFSSNDPKRWAATQAVPDGIQLRIRLSSGSVWPIQCSRRLLLTCLSPRYRYSAARLSLGISSCSMRLAMVLAAAPGRWIAARFSLSPVESRTCLKKLTFLTCKWIWFVFSLQTLSSSFFRLVNGNQKTS